jgi:hypothetical protein
MQHRFARTAAAVLAASSAALAQDTIELFGVTYDVTRFEYSAITFDNPLFPGFDLSLVEVEGTQYLPGDDALLLTTDALGDQSGPSNAIVQVDLVRDGDGVITGIRFNRVVRFVDEGEFDLNIAGVTINTGPTGLGAGGNIVAASGESFLMGFDLATGALLQPTASCAAFACGLPTAPFNTNLEDVAYVPSRGAFYTVAEQDGPDHKVVVFEATGALVTEFPVAVSFDPSLTGSPKGITFLAEADGSNPFGQDAVVVALDDEGPGLQAFDLDGNLIAFEPLADDAGEPLLEVDGFVLQLESMGHDADRGTLFLTNQGDVFTQNFLWVLEPRGSAPCRADIDGDGALTLFDFLAFQNLFDAGDLAADFDGDGSLTLFDFLAFQNAFDAGC